MNPVDTGVSHTKYFSTPDAAVAVATVAVAVVASMVVVIVAVRFAAFGQHGKLHGRGGEAAILGARHPQNSSLVAGHFPRRSYHSYGVSCDTVLACLLMQLIGTENDNARHFCSLQQLRVHAYGRVY